MSEQQQGRGSQPLDGEEYGAVIWPTDAYCHPRTVPEDSDLDWEIHPVDELEGQGITACPICHTAQEDSA